MVKSPDFMESKSRILGNCPKCGAFIYTREVGSVSGGWFSTLASGNCGVSHSCYCFSVETSGNYRGLPLSIYNGSSVGG